MVLWICRDSLGDADSGAVSVCATLILGLSTVGGPEPAWRKGFQRQAGQPVSAYPVAGAGRGQGTVS